MSAERQEFDEEVYEEEVEYDGEYDDEDGMIEEVELDESEGPPEELGAQADDEEEQAGGAAPGGRGQMLYIPGLGYIPLASLGNIPGLNIGGARAAASQAPASEGERDWKGLAEMPAVTQDTIGDLASALREDGKKELTLLLLGKGGVGKSSTLNSLLNERAANVTPLQQDNAKPTAFARRSPDGFLLTIIDTPSLLDQDAVSEARLEGIGRAIREREIDAILYVDRLDGYAVDALDRAVVSSITRVLGPWVWNNVILCLTRASESSAPPGVDFEEHVAAREAGLRAAIEAAGGPSAHVSVALVENSSRCPKNADGENIVAGDVPWVADVLEKAVDVALNVSPYEYRPAEAARAADPSRRRKWLIPLILAAQVGAKLLLDRVLDDDGCKGDASGPFDPQTVEERREELREERRRAEKRRQRASIKAAAPLAEEDMGSFDVPDEFKEAEEEDDDDWE